MVKIQLETADGGFVTDGLMPPFNEDPAVIIWGTRVFRRWADVRGKLIYRECFAWFLAPEATVEMPSGEAGQ